MYFLNFCIIVFMYFTGTCSYIIYMDNSMLPSFLPAVRGEKSWVGQQPLGCELKCTAQTESQRPHSGVWWGRR